jgi:hypothetical protein
MGKTTSRLIRQKDGRISVEMCRRHSSRRSGGAGGARLIGRSWPGWHGWQRGREMEGTTVQPGQTWADNDKL